MKKVNENRLIEREYIYKMIQKDMKHRRILYWCTNTGWGKTTTIKQYFAYANIPYISIDVTDDEFAQKIEQAAASGNAHILVDDLQNLDTEQMSGFNEYLEQISGNSKFYLLSRAWIPSYMKKYEITNELVYYANEQLAFNEKEAEKLFELYGIECDPTYIRQIVKQTQGWIVYLILMAHRGKKSTKLTDKIIELARLDLFDFLDHNVWANWDQEIRNFLLNMGHLQTFTEREACIVCGKPTVSDILSWIQSKTSFMIQDDDTTYHFKRPMEFYLARKQKQLYDEATIKQRYENTALYFAMENDLPNALKYYSMAGDRQKITEMLIENFNSLSGDAYYYELEKYYLDLDEEIINNSPEMMSAMAMLHSLSMRIEKSDFYLKRLVEFEKNLPSKDPRKKIAKSKIAFLQLALPHLGSGTVIEKFINLSKMKIDMQATSITGDMPGIMNGGLDFCEWSKNDRKLYRTMKLPMSLVFGKYADGLAEISLGESLYEKNTDGNYTESLMLLNTGKSASEIASNLQLQFAANGLIARMFFAEGRLSTALDIMEKFYSKVLPSGKRQLPLNIEAFLIRLHMLAGENEPADAWMTECAPNENEHFYILERYRYLLKVKLYTQKKMYLEALSLLDRLEQYFVMYGRKYNLAEAKLLRSMVLYRSGNQTWNAELGKALDITYEYRLVRIVADLGAAIMPLLVEYRKTCVSRRSKKESDDYLDYLDILLKNTQRQASYYPKYMEHPKQYDVSLTEAESRVLALLASGMTNQEIAEIIQVSVATVKSHAGSIYMKLNVKNRTSAVQVAKEIGLI